MTDQEFDELLLKALVQAASEDARETELLDASAWVPSPAYCRWEENFLNSEKRQRRRRRCLRNAACLLLVAVVGATALLGINPTVRADFVRWVKEISPAQVHYQFQGEARADGLPVCRLTWLPEGYEETEHELEKNAQVALTTYCNDEEQIIHFSYFTIQDGIAMVMNTAGQECTSVQVSGNEGELYLGEDPEHASKLTWTDEDANLFFHLSGFVTEEQLMKMAESLTIEENGEQMGG